ncbi:MAG TPA: exosortase-associated EpsI family protein [Chlorobaculum parvum]|uniref:Exosortase-associated EpsI family protein n=1 Tax=Chlorobaculum parvum TaxID=274539 RepID=A0A7C5DDL6_9CHLB|nr:exosortase-associated EpsI family protein [Chlorobaculum parvum]
MKLNKYHFITLLFGVLLVLAQLLIFVRQHKTLYAKQPDLERLISIHPPHWHEVEGAVSNPAWKDSAEKEYDLIVARTYQNDNGQRVTIVMTWSRDGIRRAGHVQQLCYSSQGAAVDMTPDKRIDLDPGKTLDLTSFVASEPGGNVQDVLYWRLKGGQLEQNRTGFERIDYRLSHRILKMEQMIHLLYGKTPDNVMVRVSSVRTIPDQPSVVPLEYLNAYLHMLSPSDRKLLTGL